MKKQLIILISLFTSSFIMSMEEKEIPPYALNKLNPDTARCVLKHSVTAQMNYMEDSYSFVIHLQDIHRIITGGFACVTAQDQNGRNYFNQTEQNQLANAIDDAVYRTTGIEFTKPKLMNRLNLTFESRPSVAILIKNGEVALDRTHHNFSNNRIKSLRGIEKITKLINLTIIRSPRLKNLSLLSRNESINVSSLSSHCELKRLNLIGINLKKTPDLNNLTNLEHLSLNRNQLTEAPDLNNLTNLEHLSLNRNQLTEAPDLRKLTSLKCLILSKNKLTKAPDLSENPELKYVNLSNNKLTQSPLTNSSTHPNLKTLNLDGNPCSRDS